MRQIAGDPGVFSLAENAGFAEAIGFDSSLS